MSCVIWLLTTIQDSVSVENAFYEDDRILEAAAVGIPDKRLGELVTALVCVKPMYRGKVTEAQLIELAKKRSVLQQYSKFITDV